MQHTRWSISREFCCAWRTFLILTHTVVRDPWLVGSVCLIGRIRILGFAHARQNDPLIHGGSLQASKNKQVRFKDLAWRKDSLLRQSAPDWKISDFFHYLERTSGSFAAPGARTSFTLRIHFEHRVHPVFRRHFQAVPIRNDQGWKKKARSSLVGLETVLLDFGLSQRMMRQAMKSTMLPHSRSKNENGAFVIVTKIGMTLQINP